ncbi:MAG: hypothetical protein SPL00_05275 [Bacilli bacterium]|nr:hypothetical protein [Bacilli bacterium]
METWLLILIIVLSLFVGLLLLPFLIVAIFIPPVLYKSLFTRNKPSKWSREGPSDINNPQMLEMWDQGLKFIEDNKNVREDIYVKTRDNFSIFGQYFDFGGDFAVIISSGRPETGVYSSFYASSYKKAKVNVMVYDSRAHGNSDGTISGMGFQEKEDIFALAKWIHEEKKINKIILHGICVGASSSCFALVDKDCPSYIVGFVSDGMYTSYYETLIHRVRHCHGSPFLCLPYFRRRIKRELNYDIKNEGPFVNVSKISVPTLMMASKEDIYSLPQKTQYLFDNLASKNKTMVWWEHGRHSHLKIVDEELYDSSIYNFVKSL